MATSSETKVLVMTFCLDDGSPKSDVRKKIRLAHPSPQLTGKQVYEFMKYVADKAMFWTGDTDFGYRPYSAKVVTTQTKNIELISVDE